MLFRWIQQLRQLWGVVGGLLGKVWTFVIDFKQHTVGIFDDIQHLINQVREEIDGIQNFTMLPQWKNRVISVPKAFELLQTTLPNLIADFITQIKSLVEALRSKIEPTEFKVEDVEGLERLPTKLVQAAEKLLAWAALIIDALATIESAIAELNQLVQDVHDFRVAIENLDGLFLSQSNPRRRITVSESARVKPT